MGPPRGGGLGPSTVALLVALLVALTVLAFVSVGGGLDRPIETALRGAPPPHASQT